MVFTAQVGRRFALLLLLAPASVHAGLVPPLLQSCDPMIDDSKDAVSALVILAADGSASLATDKGDRKLDVPMDLSWELISRDNNRRLLDPDHSPRIVVQLLAPGDMPARVASDWLLASLGELSTVDMRKRVRVLMVGIKPTGSTPSEKDMCAVGLPASVLRKATGTWSQLGATLRAATDGTLSTEDARESSSRALKWHARDCNRGRAAACESAGALLLRHDLLRDPKLADRLLQRGCDLGSAAACRELSEELFKATELDQPKAFPRAEALLRKACHAGDVESCTELGDKLIYGAGVRQDLAAASRLLKGACESKDPRACMLLKAPELQSR
jgi:hypothetical protein